MIKRSKQISNLQKCKPPYYRTIELVFKCSKLLFFEHSLYAGAVRIIISIAYTSRIFSSPIRNHSEKKYVLGIQLVYSHVSGEQYTAIYISILHS